MAIKLVGTTSGTEQDVDTSPKAARVVLYDSAGNALAPNAVYSGVVNIKVRQSATTAGGVVTWGLYNGNASKVVHIRRIYLEMFFDGTAAATNMEYEMGKMTGITVFSGGAVVTPTHKITSQSGVQVSSARVLDTGLTTTSGTFGGAFWNSAMGRVTQTTTNFQHNQLPIYDSTMSQGVAIQLVQNEALVLRQLVTSVIGDRVQGFVDFAEV